jgi:hypothetical protein
VIVKVPERLRRVIQATQKERVDAVFAQALRVAPRLPDWFNFGRAAMKEDHKSMRLWLSPTTCDTLAAHSKSLGISKRQLILSVLEISIVDRHNPIWAVAQAIRAA